MLFFERKIVVEGWGGLERRAVLIGIGDRRCKKVCGDSEVELRGEAGM